MCDIYYAIITVYNFCFKVDTIIKLIFPKKDNMASKKILNEVVSKLYF